jgi:hypothetical protein
VTWIDRTHYRRSRQTRLAPLTPIEFGAITNTSAALTA